MGTGGSQGRRFKTHPESVAGDFYVVNGECVCCGAPHVVAPDLIGWADTSSGGIAHCIWKKQPETDEEVERAIMVIEVSEVGCHRYAGTNPQIIGRISQEYCDNPFL